MRGSKLAKAMGAFVVLASMLVISAFRVSGPAPKAAAASSPQVVPPAGYWMAGSDGGAFGFGASAFSGSMAGHHLDGPVVGVAADQTGDGYWLAATDGGVFAFGDAGFFGSMGGRYLAAPISGIAATPDGQGYWLVGQDGGVFAFGDARFIQSLPGLGVKPAAPIVGIAATPTGNGYWLVGADGGVFNIGDATFHGSMGGKSLAAPIVGITGTPTGNGYWLAGSDGGVFAFGDALYEGSMGGKPLVAPVVAILSTLDGGGYWLLGADGGVFAFGDAPFAGSLAGSVLAAPIVGMARVGPTVGGRVLLVGTFNGIPGQYSTIQAAVDAAQPGDWILIAPGDYHENDDMTNPPSQSDVASGWYGAVDIETPDLHLRGMNRNSVVVDGTNPGAPECSNAATDQNFGATGVPGYSGPVGRNGILVWKADNVSIENLTVCNFLGVNGNGGNGIWWNGGAESGSIGMAGYSGDYLTATSTFDGPMPIYLASPQRSAKHFSQITGAGVYGIFASDAAGPGVWSNLYANNFTDSGMYIGACQQLCDAWVHNTWTENSALGYSGTNSGGTIVMDHNLFDNNVDGLDTNTQSAGDPPPPQDGSCPDGGTSGYSGTHSCWVFMDNVSTNNNNANAPGYGSVGEPVGTGMTLSGGRNDTVMDNTFSDNGAWGTLIVPYPDSDPGPTGVCAGSGGTLVSGFGCVYDPENDALVGNTYSGNGSFGNPSNGDYGQITLFGNEPQNCYSGNVAPDGSTPSNLEQVQSLCGPLTSAANTGGSLLDQVLCDTGFASAIAVSCTGDNYPTPGPSAPVMAPVPQNLPTMPNPCQGVPANPWCPGGKPAS